MCQRHILGSALTQGSFNLCQGPTDLVGARVEHEGLALFFGMGPSARRGPGSQRPRGPQPGQHHGRTLPLLLLRRRSAAKEKRSVCRRLHCESWR